MSRPGLNAAISAALTAGGILSVWWGAAEMNALGYETNWTAMAIAIGLLAAILGSLFFYNFMWGYRIVSAMRRDEGVIARWTVPPGAFDQFRALDRELAGGEADNDYMAPRETPSAGVEVIFSADGVLIGDTYFGLATTGLGRFAGVRLRAGAVPCLEFATILTSAISGTQTRIMHVPGVLRVPTARDAQGQAAKVYAHYEDVIARRTIVKPHFWRTRIKIGLIGAAVSATAAVAGFGLRDMNQALANVPLIMAVAGTMFALGGIILAAIAWLLLKHQREG